MRIIHLAILLAASSCAVSDAKTPSDVSVELSSVTLGDDCPSSLPPPPPQGFAKPPPAGPQSTQPAARGSCARPPCPSPNRRACEQTSMQLSFAAQAGRKPTTVKIKRVELLDDKGKVLDTLTATVATQWDAKKGAYTAWDGTLSANDTIKSSYRLSSPNWGKLGGRMVAQQRSYQLRVVVTVGGSDRVLEKQAIIPAHIEPMVVT